MQTASNFVTGMNQEEAFSPFDYGAIGGLTFRLKRIELFTDLNIGLSTLIIAADPMSPENFINVNNSRSITVGLAYILD